MNITLFKLLLNKRLLTFNSIYIIIPKRFMVEETKAKMHPKVNPRVEQNEIQEDPLSAKVEMLPIPEIKVEIQSWSDTFNTWWGSKPTNKEQNVEIIDSSWSALSDKVLGKNQTKAINKSTDEKR